MKLFGRKKPKNPLLEILNGQDPPTFPQGVMKLMRLLRDPDSDIKEIAEALSWDPGLVLRLLKLVNSAAFGVSKPIDSVPHAVSMLGRSQLEQLVLGVAVKECLPRVSNPAFDSSRFWYAAFLRAALARNLADRLHPAASTQSFTGGLLQDMAVPLLVKARGDEYGRVLQDWHGSPRARLHVLEREVLGFSHDEVGGHLAQTWELPETLQTLIQCHHQDDLSDREFPAALRLVSVLRETEVEHGLEALIEIGRSDYGVTPEQMQETLEGSQKQARELARELAD